MFRYLLAIATIFALTPLARAQPAKSKKPNIVLIMTDDQGHGDLGIHGNPVIKTPNIDKFAKRSLRMRNFHVNPVCSPTRASLMTGRYYYRTGVVDTFQGRSMMHADEITLAEILRALGYRTGIFGKWHLGDCYPLRAMDQGFMESLVLKGGGIGQPSDPPGGTSYFNPILQHNGKSLKKDGYISDILTDAAIDFIAKNKDGPFFCYLPYNCPHGPLEVPAKYYDIYKGKIKLDAFPKIGFPVEGKVDLDETAKIYGMITNIDDNLGRLFARLEELGIADNTIIIFLTDNGPQQPRFNSGMRGRKATLFEGGTRVPFFVYWPGMTGKDLEIDALAAHIDVAPTLVEIAGGKMPADRKIDGKSLVPLWAPSNANWPDRSIFFQWHRGDVPEMYRAFAVRTPQWRLVQPAGIGENSKFDKNKLMLFDMKADPYGSKDVAGNHPEVVAKLKKQYEDWFTDVESTRHFKPPLIVIGSDKEPITTLTRQDMREGKFWLLQAEKAGKFDVEITLQKPAAKDTVALSGTGVEVVFAAVKEGETKVVLRGVPLAGAEIRFEPIALAGKTRVPVRYAELRKLK